MRKPTAFACRKSARLPFRLLPLEPRTLLSAINLAIGNALPKYTANTTPEITGTVDDPTAAVHVTITQTGGSVVLDADAVADGQGNWSLTPSEPLADGHYDLLVTASDNDGADTGQVEADNSLIVDTVAPTVALDAGQLPVIVSGNPTLTGTFSDANIAGIVVTLDDGQGHTVQSDATLNLNTDTWSATLPTGSLPDGAYQVTATATDLAGNSSSALGTAPSTLDTTPPTVALDANQLPLVTAHDVVLTGTCSDANIAGVQVTLDDGQGDVSHVDATLDADAGTWTATLAIGGRPDATYAVSLQATDLAGNSTTVGDAGSLTIDTAAPTVNIDSGQLPVAVNQNLQLTGTYADANISGVTVALDDGQGDTFHFPATLDTGAGTWTATIAISGVPDNAYGVSATATDQAGNSTTTQAAGGLTVDTTGPAVSIVDQTFATSTPIIQGALGADAASVRVTVNDVTYTSDAGDVVIDATTWTLALPALADGSYDISATALDALGNATTTQGHMLVDATPPVVAINDGQLPVTTNSTLTLTGTYVEANLGGISVTLDNGRGGTFLFPATANDDGAWTASIPITGLADGAYSVSVTATDLAAHTTTIVAPGSLTVDTTAPTVSVGILTTNDATPPISGTVNDPSAAIAVTIRGTTYNAINNGDGTWTLPDNTVAALPDGIYKITVQATDTLGNQSAPAASYLAVDTAVPVVAVNPLVTTSTSPALTGTVNDNAADIAVTVNGATYPATNNGDGTWSLAGGALPALTPGVYRVSVSATNAFGTVGTNANAAGALTVASTQTIQLGAATKLTKVTYTDSDGTLVTVTTGPNAHIALTFTGTGLAVTGNSKTARAITGSVLQVDIQVLANSNTLAIATNAAGDGVTAINQISLAGNLVTLSAKGVTLAGGITTSNGSYIQNITLHDVESDITMGTCAKGVSITADSFDNSTITTGVIATFKARSSFAATSVHAVTINSVTLANVRLHNNGDTFGFTATKIKSLKLAQGPTTLTWKKNFISSLFDFLVVG